MDDNDVLPEGSPYSHPEKVLIELVCRLSHYSGVTHFWRVITQTWLEQSNVNTKDIRRTTRLVTDYRLARLAYRTKHLAEHKQLSEAERGLTKAMDWWIARVGENINAEYTLRSDNTDKKTAIHALDRLVSHYQAQIAMRPVLVFHHAPWVPAYTSWNKSPEMAGYPPPSFGIRSPQISQRGESYLAAMSNRFKETEEEKREGIAADLGSLSLSNSSPTMAPTLPENCSLLDYENMVEAIAIEEELAVLNARKALLEQRLEDK